MLIPMSLSFSSDPLMNLLLYVSTVLIWGSTWIAIAWQLGPIPIEVSVLYRFALAALALWQIHFDLFANLGLGFAGLGLGLVLPALSVVVQNALPREDRGIGMSLFNFGRELGGAVGVAICAMLFHGALPAGTSHNLASLSPAELAPGFSATYVGMALIASAALLITLLALKRHELASIPA